MPTLASHRSSAGFGTSTLDAAAASAADIFSPTRLSPSFSPIIPDLEPLLPAIIGKTESTELSLDEVSKYGLTSTLCAQNMIPRDSPLLAHRSSSPSLRSTKSQKVAPLNLFISSRYRRSARKQDRQTKQSISDVKHPKVLPSFQFTCSSHDIDSNSDSEEDNVYEHACDKTPTLSPARRDRTPTVTPTTAKLIKPEAQASPALLDS